MGTYAADTSVSVESSRAEIERTLRRYGADSFVSGWDRTQAMIGFAIDGRQVRFVLPMPDPTDFALTPTGRTRSPAQIEKAWEQAGRQRWRALALVVKAKLEAVEAGISTIEQEFLAQIMLPNSQTVHEWLGPQIERAYAAKQMPPMLPIGSG